MTTPDAIRWMRDYYHLLASINDQPFRAHHTKASAKIVEAQRLHAEVYLKHGFIALSDIGEDSRMHLQADPYQEHSRYFVVASVGSSKKRVVATARQINVVAEHGHASLPTMTKLKLYPRYRNAISQIDPNHCVEISGLAKAKGVSTTAVLLLYRSMWHYSLRHNHRLWLMACDAKVYGRLKFLFGDALVRIGPSAFYMGSEVVPAMLEVDRSMLPLIESSRSMLPVKRAMKREMVTFFLTGLSKKYRPRLEKPIIGVRELVNQGSNV